MIRSRLSGRYIKPPVQVSQRFPQVLVLAGIAVLGGLMIGWNLASPSDLHSPVPQGYSFEVQAHEEPELTPEVTVTPSTTTTVEPTEMPVTPTNEVVEYIKSKAWPAHEALAVAKCESGYYEKAHGDLHLTPSSYGVFQIRAFTGRPEPDQLFNYKQNIDYAFQMWSTQGWGPWSCKRVL